jgi:hypothetical protein
MKLRGWLQIGTSEARNYHRQGPAPPNGDRQGRIPACRHGGKSASDWSTFNTFSVHILPVHNLEAANVLLIDILGVL